MKNKVLPILLAITCLAATPVVASDIAGDAARWQREEIDLAMAPIKSRADLFHHLRIVKDSPLSKLSPRARHEFVGNLVFTRKGLGSYPLGPLASLSVTDKWAVLSLFGLQSSVGDLPGVAPTNEIEQHMLEMQPMVENWTHKVCVIQAPNSWCESRYGSGCSRACD